MVEKLKRGHHHRNLEMKRIKKVKKKCANPLFEKWLLEWRDEARAKSSEIESHLTKAIISLQKYPLPLETGKDCILLQNFGSKLCAMLDKKLKTHLAAKRNTPSSDSEIVNSNKNIVSNISPKLSKIQDGSSVIPTEPMKKKLGSKKNALSSDCETIDINNEMVSNISPKTSKNRDGSSENTKEPQKKKFVPKRKKETVIRRSREHSMSPSASSCGNDSPIIRRINNINDEIPIGATSKDNAAKNKAKVTKVVQEKGIVVDNDSDDIVLVDDEDNAAKKKARITTVVQEKRLAVDNNSEDVVVVDDNDEDTAETLVVDEFQMAPNSFDVFLLVDNHETAGGKTKAKNDATISELNKLKTRYEVRPLRVGDFGWIARCRDTRKELVLPYLVERKRMDDLASSIKDGRFHEQKYRLKQCGVPNIIYLLESYGKNQHLGMPLESLLQAATNLYVQDGFQTKLTQNHRRSMQYLSNLTTYIYESFKDKHLISSTKENLDNDFVSKKKVKLMEFDQFNKAASKTQEFTVKEMFVKHLLQLQGITVDKALAIVGVYPTPIILLEAFQSAGDEASKLLAPIKVEKQRPLGPALSKKIFELYTRKTFE